MKIARKAAAGKERREISSRQRRGMAQSSLFAGRQWREKRAEASFGTEKAASSRSTPKRSGRSGAGPYKEEREEGRAEARPYKTLKKARLWNGSADCGARQFAPGDELNLLFSEQLTKFRAGEEIEIALAPGRSPSVALARGSFHFVIG